MNLPGMTFSRLGIVRAAGLAMIAASYCTAASDGQSFASAEQAAGALVKAAGQDGSDAMLQVLGPSAQDIVVSGDPVEDKNARTSFVAKAKAKRVLIADPEHAGGKILVVGSDAWPLPIPLVQDAGKWRFDVDAGRDRILSRRIGDNELSTIEVCRGFVEAQYDFADRVPAASGRRQYAERFFSSEGRRDGLYWRSDDGKDLSPIAEAVAQAMSEGYTDKSQPYHGYRFKILKGQGEHAPGGAMSYQKDGIMSGGFALIAWPAAHGSSGVMTFLVDRTGIVYQKDLGEQTDALAAAMDVFDPDNTWSPVRDGGAQMATAR